MWCKVESKTSFQQLFCWLMGFWRRRTEATASKLLVDHNLAVLTRKKNQVERLGMHLFTSRHQSESHVPAPTLVTHLDELSALKQRLTRGEDHWLPPPEASEKQVPNWEKWGKRRQHWCSMFSWIDFCLMRGELVTFYFAAVVVAVTHLDRDLTAYYIGTEWNLNAPSIIGKSDKQEDLHLNAGGSGADTRCIWITAGELVCITGRTHLAFFLLSFFGGASLKAKLAASYCQVPFSSR